MRGPINIFFEMSAGARRKALVVTEIMKRPVSTPFSPLSLPFTHPETDVSETFPDESFLDAVYLMALYVEVPVSRTFIEPLTLEVIVLHKRERGDRDENEKNRKERKKEKEREKRRQKRQSQQEAEREREIENIVIVLPKKVNSTSPKQKRCELLIEKKPGEMRNECWEWRSKGYCVPHQRGKHKNFDHSEATRGINRK